MAVVASTILDLIRNMRAFGGILVVSLAGGLWPAGGGVGGEEGVVRARVEPPVGAGESEPEAGWPLWRKEGPVLGAALGLHRPRRPERPLPFPSVDPGAGPDHAAVPCRRCFGHFLFPDAC